MPKKNPAVAKVDEYAERPYAEAVDPDADAPREQADQIADYHDTHPTLDVSGKEHDPEFQAKAKDGIETPAPESQDA